jgi:glycosyltransferase involved in cell wall biosynthesis
LKRLLVVTYYFPPSGGAGVQRVLKWVKYLRDFGVEPVVLTVEAGAYPSLDPALARDVPPGIRVHRTPSLDPFGAYARLTGRSRQDAVAKATGRISDEEAWAERAARWLRANLFVPDARVGWVPFAIREGLRMLRGERFDAVLTSGPPHSTHLTGYALHRRTGVPWIADFRDPWTAIHYNQKLPRTRLARGLDRTLERAVLRRASAVIAASPSMRDLLMAEAGRPANAAHVLYNGFDPEDFEGEAPPRGEAFVLGYVGTLYGQPAALWDALARVRGEGLDVRVRIVGSVPPETPEVIGAYGLGDAVAIGPYVPHDEAVGEMRRAAMLLLTLEPWLQAEAIVPGKVFEYLAAGRPILGIGPLGSDVAALVGEAGAGRMFAPDDRDGIAAHLREAYHAWEEGRPLGGAPSEHVARFDRRLQAGALADLVRRIGP